MMRPLVSNAAATPQPSPTVPGTVLAGKYRVERILGQGGMGVVVEARHIALDERVALKFLLPEYATHPEASARFLREAQAAAKIKSEHVARVSDVGTLDTGAPYMVMEFLEGRDLSRTLETEGVLQYPDAVDYIIQACEAIAEAHSYTIVHRDLKPANLFLAKRPDGSPIVKVLDFGISKRTGGDVDNLTKTTAAMGSALYMSPEQMQQTKSVDHRTDVYALGISLYELLAGKQPFYADTLPQLCAEILTGIPTPLRTLRPDVPDALAAVIEKAYARDRAQRYQSVAEFVVALAPYALPRSAPVVERVARMGGLPIPQQGTSGVFAAPQAGSSGVFAASAVVGGGPQPTTNPGMVAQAPAYSAPVAGGTQLIADPNPPARGGGTVALPVMDPTTGQGAPPPAPPPPQQPGAHQIVPGPYTGPMSVRAAASFAQGATTNSAIIGAPRSGGKAGVFALLVVGLLAVGGIATAVWWKMSQKPAQPPVTEVKTQDTGTPAGQQPSGTPVVTATVSATAPVPTATADKPVETAKPIETTAPHPPTGPAGKGTKPPTTKTAAPAPAPAPDPLAPPTNRLDPLAPSKDRQK
jgi:serine/threonine-protein kinase